MKKDKKLGLSTLLVTTILSMVII